MPKEQEQDDLNHDDEYGSAFDEDETTDDLDEDDHTEDDDQDDDPAADDGEDSQEPDPKLEEQRRKSWEGRIRADEQRLAEERRKLEEERQRLEREKTAKPDTTDEQPDDEPDFKDLEEDYPELAPHFKALSQTVKTEQEQRRQAEADRKAEQEAAAQQAREAHFAAITERHPDAFELKQNGELDAWLDEMPRREALAYETVLQHGTADQINSMLDAFKQKPTARKPNQQRTRQAESLAAVKGNSRGPRPRGKPDPNDYESAWDEDD